MNIVVLSGRLGSDPEIKTLQSGKIVGSANLAVDQPGRDGKMDTMWVRLDAWDKNSERLGSYKKGSAVTIEGRLVITKKANTETGSSVSYTSVTVDKFLYPSTDSKNAGAATKPAPTKPTPSAEDLADDPFAGE